VSAHERRAEIEAALAAGTSYREVESACCVSRSALTRHKQRQGASKERQTVEDKLRGEHEWAAKLEIDAQSLTEHFRQK